VSKPYSLDLREKIVSTYEAGNTSIRRVAERFQVSKTTVQALLQRKQATGTLKPAPATGGKASPLAGYEQDIAEMVKRHQDYTWAEYCEYWQDKTGVRISESVMCRFLQKQPLTGKKNLSQRSSGSNSQASSTSGRLADD
jgi:transposase